MEFLLILIVIMLPLALAVGGIALIVNAMQSIRETLDQNKRRKTWKNQ